MQRAVMSDSRIEIRLPDWVAREVERLTGFDSPEQRMDLVIRLAESNARHGSGGPFAAAVFGLEDRALIAEEGGVSHLDDESFDAQPDHVIANLSELLDLVDERDSGSANHRTP